MEETKKYYWVVVESTGKAVDKGKSAGVIDIHPFMYMEKINNKQADTGMGRVFDMMNQTTFNLLDWKQIDVSEYNLYNELNNK